MSSGKKIVAFSLAALTIVLLYIIAITLLFPQNIPATKVENFPVEVKVYGIADGTIVELNLTEKTEDYKPFYSYETPILSGTKTENYMAYITEDSKLYSLDLSEMTSSEVTTETPDYYSIDSLTNDNVIYSSPKSEIVEKESNPAAEPAEKFYSEIKISSLANPTAEPYTLSTEEGEPVKANTFATSTSGDRIVVSTYETSQAYLYDSKGELIEELPIKVSKVGFLNDETLWYSDMLGAEESNNQEVKLYDINTGKITNLYDNNKLFSQISLLDFVKIGDSYVLLGNSYSSGTPKQTIFQSNSRLDQLDGVVTLSSLSLNSNGKVFPISESEYLVDVRSSNRSDETATLRISTVNDEGSVYENVSNLFTDFSDKV